MPLTGEHSARLEDPSQYEKFARKNGAGGKGVDFIFGIKNGKSEVQSIRFDKSKFTPKEAKEWLRRNKKKNLAFTPAKDVDHESVGVGAISVPVAIGENIQYSIPTLKADEMENDIDEDSPALGLSDDEKEMWCEAFATGKHPDSMDPDYDWTPNEVEEIANTYNEKKAGAPAPVVLGHLPIGAPALGWVDKAKMNGNKLLLKLTNLDKNFVDALKSGAYKTRSIRFTKHPGDKYNISHLAFLGAEQPAIKDLQPLSFSASEDKTYTFEFKESDMSEMIDVVALEKKVAWYDKLFNKFKMDVSQFAEGNDSIVELETGKEPEDEGSAEDLAEDKKLGGGSDAEAKESTKREDDAADAPDVEIKIGKQAQAQVKDDANEAMSENETLKLEVEALKKQLAALEDAISNKDKVQEETEIKEDNRAFCESLVRTGHLRPADLDVEIRNLEDKSALDSARQFGEPSPYYTETYVESYKKILASKPKIVEFAEIATPEIAAMNGPVSIPSIDEFVAKFVEDKMKSNPNISYGDAMLEAFNEVKDEGKKAEYFKKYCGR